MNRTDCPYLDCREAGINGNAQDCPRCGRWLKVCGKCQTFNRSFANYCRFCGQELPVSSGSWPAAKGGAQRLAFNQQVLQKSPSNLKIEEHKTLHFSGQCRSLLAEDGFLITVSDNGIIQVVDLNHPREEPYEINAGAKILAEPAIHDGTLYVGILIDEGQDRGGVQAFTLGDAARSRPEVRLRWEMGIKGRPVQALLPFKDRLYLNIGFKDAHREIQLIDHINKKNPSKPVTVYEGERISTLVANPPTKKVFFLAQSGHDLLVNSFDHNASAYPEITSTPVTNAPTDFLDHIPLAVMGAKVFAVFGPNKNLCRIDAHTGSFDSKVGDRVRAFALSGMNRQVIVNSTGIFSTVGNIQEDLIRGEGIISGPVIIKENTAVVGMRDGKIRFYQVNNLAVQLDYQVFDSGSKVLALAAFKDMVAVGNQKGEAKVLRLS